MTATQTLEARARAELEMFFLSSVEEGVLMLAAMSRSNGMPEDKPSTEKEECEAPVPTGKRGM